MRSLIVFSVVLLATFSASAQSLDPQNPYPLKAGINRATSDSLVGVHYWYFYAMPGNSRITARLKTPTTLYGASLNSTLTITISDARGGRATKTINGTPNGRETTFTATKLDKRVKIVVSVAPPNQSLIRMGGDYEIEATGDVAFEDVKNAVDPIVRTFDSNGRLGVVKFFADGTVETAEGYRGTWKVFDRENRIYVVVIENQERYSLQYRPGYGLVRPADPNMIVFQELKH